MANTAFQPDAQRYQGDQGDQGDQGELDEARRWVIAQVRADAGAALQTGMDTMQTLRSLGMDSPGLLAGLLQPLLPINQKEQELIAEHFGALVLTLLHGVAHMRQLSSLSRDRNQTRNEFTDPRVNEENLRKMLITMVDDIRVVLIELARHLSVLRLCHDSAREVQDELGRITLDVYAPLANRLGVGQIKWQMEDHALRCLEPENYHQLASKLAETRGLREQYIAAFISTVQNTLEEVGVVGEVFGRPKHIYSILRKMRAKDLAFENLRDIRAFRIIVDDVADCYTALAAVHGRWRVLDGEFDDYIATPKDNGYQSIHTVVTGPDEQTVEVQIRTRQMHRQSELGVAAHWRYKEKVRADEGIDQKVIRLRQLLQWKDELLDAAALTSSSGDADEPIEARIFVFTPKGTVIDLPDGATPIDFAYAIHTELGHRIRGARVNEKMVTLGHRLATGQQVHIQTAKDGHPSRDWLRNDLGYVRTRRARARITQWFKRADYAQHVSEGRSMLERELARLGREDLSYDKIARNTHFHKTDALLAAIGAGDFKLSRALVPFRRAARVMRAEHTLPSKPRAHAPDQSRHPDSFRVRGVDNLLTRMAHCCHPIPGDAIVGFITLGRGVSIHRENCHNIKNLDEQRRARLIEVRWGESEATAWPLEIQLTAYNRSGLLNDINEFLKQEKIQVLKLNRETDDEHGAHIRLKLEIADLKKLGQILKGLARIPNVAQVKRVAS